MKSHYDGSCLNNESCFNLPLLVSLFYTYIILKPAAHSMSSLLAEMKASVMLDHSFQGFEVTFLIDTLKWGSLVTQVAPPWSGGLMDCTPTAHIFTQLLIVAKVQVMQQNYYYA